MNINHIQTTPPAVMHRPVINQQLVKQAETTLPTPEKVQHTAAQRAINSNPHQARTLHTPTWQFDSRFQPQKRPTGDIEHLIPKTTGSLDLLHQQAQEAYAGVVTPEHKLSVDRLI